MSTADYRLRLAESCYYQGRLHQAIELLKGLLSDMPNEGYLHALLACCLLNKGRVYAAEYELSIALSLDPNQAFLYKVLSQVAIQKGEYKVAIDYADQALSLDGVYVEALLVKAQAQQFLRKPKMALSCLQQAAAIGPDILAVKISFADFCLQQNELSSAQTYLLEALNQDAQDETANLLMGQLRLRQDCIEDAEYHAKFVIMQNPNSTAALQLLSNIKMRKSLIFGLWWKVNTKLAHLSDLKGALVLILAYLAFNLLSQVMLDLGFSVTSLVISFAWLFVVLYSWVGIPYYHKILKKELASFVFKENY